VRLALILVVAIAGSVHAAPNQQLAAARQAFRSGHYAEALPLYNALLYPTSKLADQDEIVEAYVNLGVCRVNDGDADGAKREFEKALGLDPNRQLDPLLVTNKEAIRLFDDTKADLRNRTREVADKEALAKALKEREDYINSLRPYKVNNFYLNFAPFGLGQAQNDDTAKAILFGAGQGVTFAASIGTWYYLVNKYGLNNQHLHIDPTEAADVRTLQQIEIGTGIAFVGLYIWGVVDAYRNYQPQVRVSSDQLPSNLRDLDKPKPPPKAKKTSFHLTPMITPNGAGIGVGWEN
jgi:tetratricopeptide (TPR) repeat protein